LHRRYVTPISLFVPGPDGRLAPTGRCAEVSIGNARLLDAVLRNDLNSFTAKTFGAVVPGTKFLPNWHLEAIAWRLQCVLDGDIKRLLITMPPRSLKSVFASVALPAFALGRDPSKRIVCVSYAEDLAAKHARDCRAVLESGWYRRLFPGTRLSRTRSAGLDFETTRHGGRLSTSVGGALIPLSNLISSTML